MMQFLRKLRWRPIQPPAGNKPEQTDDEIRQWSLAKLEETNRYFATIDELTELIQTRHLEDDNADHRQAAERFIWLLCLRPEMARAKARAVYNLLCLGDEGNCIPARTIDVSGRSLRVLNGGLSRRQDYFDELLDAVHRADPDDPAIQQIVDAAAQFARRLQDPPPHLTLYRGRLD